MLGKDILVVNLLKDHKDLPDWPQIEKNILEVESLGVKVIRTECDYDNEIGFFKKK